MAAFVLQKIRDNLEIGITVFHADWAKRNIIFKKAKKIFKKALTNFPEYGKRLSSFIFDGENLNSPPSSFAVSAVYLALVVAN